MQCVGRPAAAGSARVMSDEVADAALDLARTDGLDALTGGVVELPSS